jgi:RNA-directed DNA polymerase
VESSLGERPNAGTEETVEPQNPHASEGRQGKKKVHSLIDKVFSRKNLELAWEKVKKNRGGAGIDEVTSAQFEARKEYSLDLLHGKLREGTYQPQPGQRVEIPKSEGGVRQLGLPRVVDRVCQQALVQRMEPICEPTCRDRAFGYRKGRSPHEARRQVWRELQAGKVGRVDADLRQFFDPSAQEQHIDLLAEAMSDGRVRHLVRDRLRAGVREEGRWRPTLTGGPQGGVASPRWSTVFLPPLDRRMAEEGFRLTRWADAFVVLGQTREEAQRALAIAARFLREELGVELQAQKTRMVHVSQGFECLGYKVKPGTGHCRPASKRRGRSHPQNLYASPREKSVQRFQEQIRSLTRRKAPLKLREVIERINPVIRGWGHFYRKADVKRLFHRLDRWIEHRIDSCLAKRWRTPLGRQYPTRRLIAELGWVRLTPLIPGLVLR